MILSDGTDLQYQVMGDLAASQMHPDDRSASQMQPIEWVPPLLLSPIVWAPNPTQIRISLVGSSCCIFKRLVIESVLAGLGSALVCCDSAAFEGSQLTLTAL
ncbi:hypothetical protein Nepgr_002590 [Nepenthes gracilis]|uniref:Uncharacterized protein n=1 Tax=Nepenthes gracilis TaxID=150966 RepID=A0AAD3P742_NEPGR|nr:hypothetical protein Nepgr_002590 [Nepenthes gracilis]